MFVSLAFAALLSAPPEPLGPGDHARTLTVGELQREYLVHVPKKYDAEMPTPVVLALHGAGMNGQTMAGYCGLNRTADEAGFIAVYPSGSGVGPFRTWNAGGLPKKWTENRPDDVAFIGQMLDELSEVVNVDEKRVYACGMSNGAMMCYRLAAELPDRIAAIAPVAGTAAVDEIETGPPVSVLHFHGTLDKLVPFARKNSMPKFITVKGAEESVRLWADANDCDEEQTVETLSSDGDDLTITRRTQANGRDGSEAVLIVIDGGGHTWPGRKSPDFLGKSAMSLPANGLIWEFFERHPRK